MESGDGTVQKTANTTDTTEAGMAATNTNTNIGLNLITDMRLGAAITNFYRSRERDRQTDGTCTRVAQFLLSFKKGSKQLRNVLTKQTSLGDKVLLETHVRTYHRLIDCPPVSIKNVNWMQKAWGIYFLPNKVREFILKFNGNILGLNTRISHFVENASRSCTFCTCTNLVPVPDETFLHLFFMCPVTSLWLTYFMNNLFMDILPQGADSLKKFWLLHFTNNEQLNNNLFFSCLLWLI